MDLATLYPPILLRRLLQVGFERSNPSVPWLTSSAVLILDSWLKPTDVGWEWGSGRSTLWIANKISRLTSIEHHAAWHKEIEGRLRRENIEKKVDYRLISCEIDEYGDVINHAYSDAILEIPDESLDFILVDGMMRKSCFRNAIRKVKKGGLLVLDNAERFLPDVFLGRTTSLKWGRKKHRDDQWEKLDDLLALWRTVHTSDGISDTRLWVKTL